MISEIQLPWLIFGGNDPDGIGGNCLTSGICPPGGNGKPFSNGGLCKVAFTKCIKPKNTRTWLLTKAENSK